MIYRKNVFIFDMELKQVLKIIDTKTTQGMTSKMKNQKPKAMYMLEKALQELNMQVVDGDMSKIAKKAKVAERTVIRYVKEKYVADFTTGKKILDIGRQLVIEREQSLSAA